MDKAIFTPISGERARSLSAGDCVLLSGTIVTARDIAHRQLLSDGGKEAGRRLSALGLDMGALSAVYHCGPIARKEHGEWRVLSAGPTTSARMDPYEPEFIRKFDVHCIIGKGGMGPRTQAALSENGCAYLSAVGGAAALLAESVRSVKGVMFLKEFGMPDAMWVLEVKDMPLTVTMDPAGNSIHMDVRRESSAARNRLLRGRYV